MMKTFLQGALGALVVLTAAVSSAQIAVPAPSPAASVFQRVGVTDFKVEYSSPAVRGRQIWGSLVPFSKTWRTGANAATRFTASQDFTFGGVKVPAGTYALYTTPGKTTWTVHLNKSAEQSGAVPFNARLDVAKASVKPVPLPDSRERLAFLFSDTTEDSARLDLEWEKLRISVPLKVDTRALVMADIAKSLDDAWRPHATAARYLLDSNGDLGQALKFADASIAIKPTWMNNWVRAQVLAKQGKTQDALAAVEKAHKLGKGDPSYEGFFKGQMQKASAEWKAKK